MAESEEEKKFPLTQDSLKVPSRDYGEWVRALEFAGYEFDYKFGDGRHSGIHGRQLFPEAMRFLWKGYPKPIAASEESRNGCMRKILLPGEKFSVAASLSEAPKGGFSESDFAPKRVEGAYLAADSSGEVYASFGPRKVKILSDGVSELGPSFHSILSFGKDGTKIVKMGGDAYWQKGKTLKKLAAKDAAGAAALFEGGFFVCGSDGLWRISPDGDDKLVDSNLRSPAAVALSANGDWLYVFEYLSRRGYSYRISREGIASLKQEFFFLHIPEYADCAQSLAAACDISGYTYVATSYGVQVCDYNGRSEAILPLPDRGAALAVCFGGKDLSTLFVLSQYGTVFSRKLRAKGSSIFEKPVKIRVGAG